MAMNARAITQAKAALADEMFAELEPIALVGDSEVLVVFRPLDEDRFWHHWCERYIAVTAPVVPQEGDTQ